MGERPDRSYAPRRQEKAGRFFKDNSYPINALVEPVGWQRTPFNAGGRVREDSRIFWSMARQFDAVDFP